MPPSRFAPCRILAVRLTLALLAGCPSALAAVETPFCTTRLLFAPETWHVHASCVVELPNGDLLACWFHGSGERTADDVKIQGARLRRGSTTWGPRFTLADTPGFPDCNPALALDPQGRLWLFWACILSNQWESALLKCQVSTDFLGEGPPRWSRPEAVPLKPPAGFEPAALAYFDRAESEALRAAADDTARQKVREYYQTLRGRARDRLAQRLGWMPRAHPVVLDGTRLLVPLYSDGYDCSLMAYTDDGGATWEVSAPLFAAGNIQPSLARRRDGSLYTLMRDNGPAPHRLHQSSSPDRGATWSPVTDSAVPNPGSGAEVINLRDGRWALISNDTESGRHRLTVQLSADEGRSWPWRRALEEDAPGPQAGRYHYPSLIQAADGTLHATYSQHRKPAADAGGTAARDAKTIKHAHFNLAWVEAGQAREP
ncbi:MAG: exo-alpha-sialidase [Verrucomicrobia bacterium]|nr:exo-alpha-sialidase [Verrucomicrobiota bacterium]